MNGKQYFLIDVIAHILCYLKKKILEEIQDFGLHNCTPNVTDIDWVITVPAIWNARGKKMMREAGYKVKMHFPHAVMHSAGKVYARVLYRQLALVHP